MRRLGALVAAALAAGTLVVGPVTAAGAQEAPPPGAPDLAFVGDSIPFEALFHYDKNVDRDRVTLWNEVGLGFKIRTVLPRIRQHFRQGDVPDIFLAFIGTSSSETDPPSQWRTELRELLDLVSPRVDCVRVFEIDDEFTGFYKLHDKNARVFNRITHQLVARYDNAEWFHYDVWAGLAGPSLERRDILHHNVFGRVKIAELMRDVVNGCDPNLTSGPYWDVPDDYPAAAAIRWVGEHHLFPGYANHTYRAQVGDFVLKATRGELLNMAWKLAGRPTGYDPHPWSDGRRALDAALRWAHGARVGTGFPDGTYRPDALVSRGQALSLLWRMAGRPGGYPDDPWDDAEGPTIRWAAATRLLGPMAPGEFRPESPLTRSQLATILFRFDALPD